MADDPELQAAMERVLSGGVLGLAAKFEMFRLDLAANLRALFTEPSAPRCPACGWHLEPDGPPRPDAPWQCVNPACTEWLRIAVLL